MKTVKLCSGHPVLLTCVASSKVGCWGMGGTLPARTSPEMALPWGPLPTSFPWHCTRIWEQGKNHVSPAYSSRIRLISDRKGEGQVHRVDRAVGKWSDQPTKQGAQSWTWGELVGTG